MVAKGNSKGDSSSANRNDNISEGESDSEQEESRRSVFNAPHHLFAVNLITLCCVVSSLVSPALAVVPPPLSQAEVAVCPEQVGGIIRALPHIPKLLTDPPQVNQITCVKKHSGTRYLKDNVFNGVQGHLCTCIRSSFNFLFDLTGLTRFVRKSVTLVPLNHTQCLNMVHNHSSLAGELKFNEDTKEWETQNEIPNFPSFLPINCCLQKLKLFQTVMFSPLTFINSLIVIFPSLLQRILIKIAHTPKEPVHSLTAVNLFGNQDQTRTHVFVAMM